MRIAIDLQGIQSEGSRKRGIGRYSFEIINNLLNYHKNNEYILVSNWTMQNVRHEFSHQLENNKNISFLEWYSPTPLSFISHKKVNRELAKLLRTYAYNCLHADIILVTSFLEGFSDNCFTEFDFDSLEAPVISIFYDLIPLLNPDLYLNPNPEFSKFYSNKLECIRNFDALLAISQSSSEEARKYLHIDKTKIFNISSACDKAIFNKSINNDHNLKDFFSKVPNFLLYSGAGDPRKNLKNLLQAFSLLPEEYQKKYNLVLVGKLLPPEINMINDLVKCLKIEQSNIHILGYVSDFDLVTLYRNCHLFVFPSLHEGFGLPVLEAMSCGAPVIGSSTTSIPEIIQTDEAMFDPHDAYKIRDLIQKSIEDDEFLFFLKSNSLIQSEKFSWLSTVDNLINICSSLVKKSKKDTSVFNWQFIQDQNTIFQDNLIKKLVDNIKDRGDINLIKVLSSSIDKTNIGLRNYLRKISNNKEIDSWMIEGPFDSNYSLSILNRSFTLFLENQIKYVFINITEGYGDYKVDTSFLHQFPRIYSKYSKSKNINNYPDVVSRNLFPPRVSDLNARINLLHAYGWEESEFPPKWISDFNLYLQGITVMSSQVKKILLDNGLHIPVRVCGLGIDHFTDNSISVDQKISLSINPKKYKFLHVSSCFPRKGIDILLEAYCNKFTNNDDVSLIIKTFENIHNNIDIQITKLKKNNPDFPHIIVLKEDLNNKEMSYLYSICDVLVAPSRGEGFGLPIAEAMFFDLPVITTGWGGQTDFCNSSNSFLLDFKFVKSQSHFDLDLSYWAEPSIRHLEDLMLRLFNSGNSYVQDKVALAKQSIAKFTWDNVVEENHRFVKYLSDLSLEITPRIGWMSTWNTRCGIASYSKHLIPHLENEVIIFSPKSETNKFDHDYTVIPSWKINSTETNNFDLILENLKSYKITTLVIQFNYGFFDFTNFSDFLNKLIMLDCKLLIFFHSTTDPLHDHTRKLINLSKVLSKVDRLFVHSISDLNRLKNIGLVDNVTLFPHGILENSLYNVYQKNKEVLSETVNIRRIASYGYLLPHKGIIQLIESIKILRDEDFKVHLNLCTSLYSDEYQYFYKEVVELILSLDLSDLVNLNTDYLTDEDSLNSLAKNDLLVFPYQSTQESSSASVRHGIASGRPVLVTPLDIFDDVSSIVNYTTGTTSVQLAKSIKEWYKFNSNDNQLNHKEKVLKIITNRGFSKLGKRFSSIIKGLYIDRINSFSS